MKRKLFFLERVIYGSGDTAFNVVVPVKISGSFPQEHLKLALGSLQEKHPFLKAFIQVDEKQMPWFVVDTGAENLIPVRMVQRNTSHDWEAEVTREWATLFDVAHGPLMRMVWIKGELSSELLLVMHHCVCDGRSAMSILADLLLLLDNPTVNIGRENPILSIHDIVPASLLKNKRKVLKAKLSGGVTALVLWLMPLKKQMTERKQDYMLNWKMDKAWSDHLIQVSKSKGLTVNTLLCKTVLTAFKEVMSGDFHNKIICPVDIRKYVPLIKEENIFAFVSMVVLSMNSSLSFLDDAAKMQQEVAKKMENLDPYAMLMQMEASHASLSGLTNFLKFSKPGSDCLFSNLGKIGIPHQYQTFEVETIYSPSAVGPLGKTTGIVASTYRGQMDFTFISSEGFLPYNEAVLIKEKIVEIINKIVVA